MWIAERGNSLTRVAPLMELKMEMNSFEKISQRLERIENMLESLQTPPKEKYFYSTNEAAGIDVLDHIVYGDGTGEAISIREYD